MDTARLKESFARVAMHGDEVALFFYSDLFLRCPETRDMFPVSMSAQRDHLLAALARIVADVDNAGQLTPFLKALGRDHRKFGALAEHYEPVGASLLATLAHFSGPDWTPEVAADWQAAFGLVTKIMTEAAAADEKVNPPFWEATVLSHEMRTFDTSVFRVVTMDNLDFQPGQSVGIECDLRPRVWRFYSIANAPRQDATLEFHVRMIDGGVLSPALTRGLRPGSRLRLGPPVGTLTFDPGTARKVLMVAGSTGLAPLKAIARQIAGLADPPQVHLFVGAQQTDGLYDAADLEKLTADSPWLSITPCVSADPDYPGERGTLPDVVARSGSWADHDAYIAGPTPMVEAMADRLSSLGVAPGQIHVEDFGWSEPCP
ncbi:MAG TPA: globin domain-containing protein [Streptosporangiaceae bacterium]|nr:globin domain-containing protein [Streptosporangiaceae bacterium]